MKKIIFLSCCICICSMMLLTFYDAREVRPKTDVPRVPLSNLMFPTIVVVSLAGEEKQPVIEPLRISLGPENTGKEISRFAESLRSARQILLESGQPGRPTAAFSSV